VHPLQTASWVSPRAASRQSNSPPPRGPVAVARGQRTIRAARPCRTRRMWTTRRFHRGGRSVRFAFRTRVLWGIGSCSENVCCAHL